MKNNKSPVYAGLLLFSLERVGCPRSDRRDFQEYIYYMPFMDAPPVSPSKKGILLKESALFACDT
ncbi:hypothetical protein JEZ13_12365 [bacterium]|nr:hypothetical protein [bacterium]